MRLFLIREGTEGIQLLTFSEPDFPEAGTQVPGGTVDPGENLLDTANREFFEETGKQWKDGWVFFEEEELLHRQTGIPQVENVFFSWDRKKVLPENWNHLVTGGGEDEGILFSFQWISLERAKNDLVDWMSAQLDRIIKSDVLCRE